MPLPQPVVAAINEPRPSPQRREALILYWRKKHDALIGRAPWQPDGETDTETEQSKPKPHRWQYQTANGAWVGEAVRHDHRIMLSADSFFGADFARCIYKGSDHQMPSFNFGLPAQVNDWWWNYGYSEAVRRVLCNSVVLIPTVHSTSTAPSSPR
jgi:hypothetical protein